MERLYLMPINLSLCYKVLAQVQHAERHANLNMYRYIKAHRLVPIRVIRKYSLRDPLELSLYRYLARFTGREELLAEHVNHNRNIFAIRPHIELLVTRDEHCQHHVERIGELIGVVDI